jgi:hypothetical protein
MLRLIGFFLQWPGWVPPTKRRGNASGIATFGIPKTSCRSRTMKLSIRRTVFDLFFKEGV